MQINKSLITISFYHQFFFYFLLQSLDRILLSRNKIATCFCFSFLSIKCFLRLKATQVVCGTIWFCIYEIPQFGTSNIMIFTICIKLDHKSFCHPNQKPISQQCPFIQTKQQTAKHNLKSGKSNLLVALHLVTTIPVLIIDAPFDRRIYLKFCGGGKIQVKNGSFKLHHLWYLK